MVLRRLLDLPIYVAAACLAVGMMTAGCSLPNAISGPQFTSQEGQKRLQRIYRLGIGDKLKVSVFGEENLSGQYEVNALGQVSLPLIGESPAKGLALHEFRDQILRRLSDGYIKNPKVTVEMLNYRPFYVQGEVKNGGEFQYKNGLSLRDAVAIAGGYSYRADQTYLFIGREGEPEVALKLPADVPVLPGDNIRIPERFF